MLLTRKQFLILLAVIIASCGAWGVVLKMFLDSSLALKFAAAWWFFGGCLVAAVILAAVEASGITEKKRHATPDRRIQDLKIKSDLIDLLLKPESIHQDINRFYEAVEVFSQIGLSADQATRSFSGRGKRCGDIKIEGDINPALKEMQKQIIEIKKAANKGIYRE